MDTELKYILMVLKYLGLKYRIVATPDAEKQPCNIIDPPHVSLYKWCLYDDWLLLIFSKHTSHCSDRTTSSLFHLPTKPVSNYDVFIHMFPKKFGRIFE